MTARVAFVLGVAACGSSGPDLPTTKVDLVSLGALEYTAPLSIGGQTFQVQIDTGSTTTAVAGMSCEACGVSPEYSAGANGTDQHQTAATMYGDMSGWNGEVFEDRAHLGASPNITLDFASITEQAQFFSGNSYQGILGLGPADLLVPHTTSFVGQSANAGDDAVMAFELCTVGGEMWLGGFDASVMAAPPIYTSLQGITNTEPYYAIRVADVGIGGTSLGLGESDFGDVLVDTGTSFTFVPTAAETALLAAVGGSTGYHAVFGSQALTDGGCVVASGATAAMVDAMLPPLTIAFPGDDGKPSAPLSLPATRSYLYDDGGGQFCFVISDAQAGPALIGDTLLAGLVTVFDLDEHAIGFAVDTGCAASGSAAEPDLAIAPTPHGSPWWRDNPNARMNKETGGRRPVVEIVPAMDLNR